MKKNCHKILLEKIIGYDVFAISPSYNVYSIQKREKQEIICYAHADPNIHVENPNGSLS